MEELDISTLKSAKRHKKPAFCWIALFLKNKTHSLPAPTPSATPIMPLADTGDLPGIPMVSL